MAQALQCEPFAIGAPRTFWTTQLDSCDPQTACRGRLCARPGLSMQEVGDSVTFLTTGWVASLALNMLLTDARRRDTRCGYAPGTLNGHWSESFMARGKPVGSHIRYVSASASVRDTMLMIKAEAQDTLQKLIDYDIAVEIKIDAAYQGNGLINLDIIIYGTAVDPTRIAVTAQRNENSWAWVS